MSKYDDFIQNIDFFPDDQGKIRLHCDKMFTWHLTRLLKQIEKEAKAIVLRENSTYSKEGKKLMNSIKSDGVSKIGSRNIRGSVSAGGAKAPYAKFVHDGTKPHRITAKPGKLLVFQWENRTGRVPTTVRVRAKNRSKNSYNGMSDLYSIYDATGIGATLRSPSPGGSGGALGLQISEPDKKRKVGGMRPVFMKRKSRNGKNRIFLAGEPQADGYSLISRENMRSGRGNRYQISGETVEREQLYRDEQRWGQGKLKDKKVAVKSVKHPGYQGNPFLRDATRKVIHRRYGFTVPFGRDTLKDTGFDQKPWGF